MKFPNDPMHSLHDIASISEVIKRQQIKDTPLNDLPTIKEFYAGSEIFITGGSGFMGKVLIEKLLRSCPDVKTIFVLLRPKKGKSIEERVNEIVKLPLFEVLRVVNPDFEHKIVPIAGDVAELKLGISTEDLERLKNVSIIFHSAASVRFDDSLRKAVLMNTRGTREVMRFAENLENIKVVMHVSTAFSNVYIHTIEERIYPAAADWKKTIEVCEKLNDDQLNSFTDHYINFMPNTYVFSKNIAEHVSNSFKEKLPLILFRPSVVISAQKEPLPGWVDNVNGPMGILLASTLGISKTMYCDPKNSLDMVPVDVCAKAMIVAAWKRAHEPKCSFPVYNAAAGCHLKITINQLLDIGINGVCSELAMDTTIWQANGGVTLCKPLNLIRLVIYQLLLASVLDAGLRFKKQKPILMGIQRKMYEANKALSYFVTNNWDFKNEKFLNLCSFLRLEDIKEFEYRDAYYHDVILSARLFVLGFRRYLLHEKDETLPRCRLKYKRLVMLNSFVKWFFYGIAFYLISSRFNVSKFLQ